MATAYHLEALRRQRIIDRRAEARRRLEEKEKAREEREEASFSKLAGSRGSSAHSTTSIKSKASKHTPSAHSRASTAERKSKSVTPEQSRASSTHSRRTSSQQSQGEAISERKEGSIGRSSKQSTPNRSRPSTAPGSGIRSKEASRVQPRASSAASSTKLSRHQLEDGGSGRQSLSTAELRVGAIRRDLHQQELILRDSNLVMGAIPVEDEIEMEGKETCTE